MIESSPSPYAQHLPFCMFVYETLFSSWYNFPPPVDPVPNEPRWSEPRRQHISCALDPSNPTENNSTLAVAFAVADINDVYECFVLQVTFPRQAAEDVFIMTTHLPWYSSRTLTGSCCRGNLPWFRFFNINSYLTHFKVHKFTIFFL